MAGHARKFTSYTNVSNKRLYWYTGTITQYGDDLAGFDYSYDGWVAYSDRFSRGVNLYGGYDSYDGYAWAGYSFTLPAATKYGTVTFKVLGKSPAGYGAPGTLRLQRSERQLRWGSPRQHLVPLVVDVRRRFEPRQLTACLWLRDGLRRE